MKQIALLLFIALVGVSECCFQCNSTTDPTCVLNVEVNLLRKCSDDSHSCYTRIVAGHTIRGCTSDLTAEERKECLSPDSLSCKICNNTMGSGCNSQTFPQHRLACHQCNGTLTSDCTVDMLGASQTCLIYKPDDECFIYKRNETNKFVRGCMSSHNGLCNEREECFICNGHGCNLFGVNDPRIPNARSEASFSPAGSVVVMFLAACIANLLK